MISYKNLTIQQVTYIEDIIRAQNKIRTNLPFISSYQADKHYQNLCSNNSISQSRLQNINPLRNNQIGLKVNEYSPIAIYCLNTGQYNECINNKNNKTFSLTYAGYIRLITTDRDSLSGGSQVNKTLFHRMTMDYQISNYNKKEKLGDNQKILNIIGMLFFLQCVKISVLVEHVTNNIVVNNQTSHFEQMRDSTAKKRRKIFDNKEKNNFQYFQTKNFNNNQYGLLPKGLSAKPDISPQTVNLKPQYYETNNLKSNNRLNTQYSSYCYNPQQTQKYQNINSPSLKLKSSSVLDKFSSQKNIWKNIAQRNWNHKQQFINRTHSSLSAFSYETNLSPRTLIFHSNRTVGTNKKIINTADRSYYYLS